LTVRGVRRDSLRESGHHYESLEIAYSTFERTLTFPVALEGVPLSMDYDAGMLLVHVRTEEGEE
jgi:HSP20 family molecular chaperone IbpA